MIDKHKMLWLEFHKKPAPRHLIADLVWVDDGYYLIRMYRDNFDSLPESTRLAATEWALDTAKRMSVIIPTDIDAQEFPPEGT